jgi:hypothetical protein
MLNKFLESLYNKVFVNVVVSRSQTMVYVEVCTKNRVVQRAEDVFDTTTFNLEMKEFISHYTAESPYSYISFLDTAKDQGAIPTCIKNQIPFYKDLSASLSRCYNNAWTFHSSQEEIYALERRYEKIGVDFIFSPFLALANFFKDKIATNMATFILIQEGYLSLCIFNESELFYAKHLDLDNAVQDEEILIYDDVEIDVDLLDEGIDLDDVDAIEEIDSFEDFGDIEDLDGIEETDDFLESTDVEEELHQEFEKKILVDQEEDGLNEDYQRFLLIQNAINEYYKDSKFESEFIQNIYIADGAGISQDLKRYLEEEMFLDVYVRQINLASSVCDLAKMELGYEV